MDLPRAGDLMIPLDRYPHIPYWFTLRQALAEMDGCEIECNGRRSLPRVVLVFDERYQLLGMVRRRDLLRGLEPELLASERVKHPKKLFFDRQLDPNLLEVAYDHIIASVKERAERPVSEVMTPIKATVDHGDHLLKVIYVVTENNLGCVPVLKDGKVAGVVRTVELCHEIAKIIL